VSPLNSTLVSGGRRAPAPIYSGAAACVALILALAFAGRVVRAAGGDAAGAIHGGDVRRAEKILAKLRLLHDAARSDDAGAYRKLVSKLYPGLFVQVAEMRHVDLRTDLSTAVFLAEKLGRTWDAAGAVTADCQCERPDIYRPLCLNPRGGTVRQLLLAKSHMHARWAEAVLRNGKGEADAETARALAEVKAARANDYLIAARVIETLKALEGRFPVSQAGADRERFRASPAGVERPDGGFADALRDADVLLAWMPRSQVFYQLSNARDAYADGLSWYGKVRQSKSLVVSVNSFAPDPVKVLGLDAEQVGATVRANLMLAIRHTRIAEQSLTRAAR